MANRSNYNLIEVPGGSSIKAWTRGVPFESEAQQQIRNVAKLPFIYRWVAVMPDVHLGIGAAVGAVIPTTRAIIPAAVGVDIGCGMIASRTSLSASDLPDDLSDIRSAIEAAVPHGRTNNGSRGDRGAWGHVPSRIQEIWKERLDGRHREIVESHRSIADANSLSHLGTLGSGNHFIEVCLDEEEAVWFLLHSGSRGVGNRIGTYFIELAKNDMREHLRNLPDKDLAYLEEGTKHFKDYVFAVSWAQDFARTNRALMMENLITAVSREAGLPPFVADTVVVNCHHNYVEREEHYGQEVFVTRKGAVRAREGDLGIIPGSMGAKSYIVRGKGNPESFHSCSHGAGRAMSRGEAKRRFSVADHVRATQGVECRKDKGVLDETPAAYKSIEAVMAAQSDLVEVVHTLKQIVCVKG